MKEMVIAAKIGATLSLAISLYLSKLTQGFNVLFTDTFLDNIYLKKLNK